MCKYLKYHAKNLSSVKRMNGVYRSKIDDDMALNDFIAAREEICRYRHKESCDHNKLIVVASDLLQNGLLPANEVSVRKARHRKIHLYKENCGRLVEGRERKP